MTLRLLLCASALPLAFTAVAPAGAQDFSYSMNTQSNVDSFRTKFLKGLANRAEWKGNAYMRVYLRPNDSNYTTTENLTEETNIETESNAPTAAELTYRIRFSSDFEFVRQGKLPGIASFQPHFGGNKNDPVYKDSWSHRLMWFPASSTTKRPDMYIYDQDRVTGTTGKHTTAPTNFAFAKNTWVTIKMVTILNTVSSSGTANRDGKTMMYVNGTLAVCRDGLKLRGNNATNKGKIGRLAFHVYHGGAAGTTEMPTSGSTYVDFDYFNYKRLSTSGINRRC